MKSDILTSDQHDLVKTDENNIGAFHSHVDLGNRHKEAVKRVCHSEPFLKPRLSLMGVISIPRKLLSYFKKKREVCFKEETTVPNNEYNPRTKVEITIISNSKPEKKQVSYTQATHPKQQVRSTSESQKGGICNLLITKQDWETITRPSAKVILDPNTANPTLMLSTDGRSVRTKTHKEFNSSKSYYEFHNIYKGKFNGWMCIQAQEGYSTGRHYWEVDVKGKCDWRIGVVKESAPRNGFVKLNTTTGYWTLRLQLGSLIALTEPINKINQAPPSRIGVCLNVEKCQVSFYDAGKRKHIYTFNAEFEPCEKIYPVFGTVETDKPLKII